MKYLNTKPGSIEEIAAKMQSNIKDEDYQQLFKKELDKAGKGIGSMSPQEKKDFFNKIDKMHKGKNEAKVDELTSGQKKLPPALQKAIKDKEDKKESVEETHMSQTKKANNHQKSADGEKEIVKSEDLDSKDKPTVKDVIGQLKGAVKAHTKQAKDLEKAMKTEADQHGDEINKDKVKASMTKGEKKPQKLHADSGSKLTKVETEPKVDYKN